MARFNVQDADNYGGQGGGGYFRLANDKEVAQVRFLYDSIQDVEGFAVHEIEDSNGKKRYVNCLRDYGQPISDCPLCANGRPDEKITKVKYFVPLYNITTGRIESWDRGKKFGQKLSSLCARYPHLVSQVFEIERNGKPGDQQTQYEIYPVGHEDNTTLDDFDEIPNPLGTHILDKTADEMQYFVDRGVFPDDDNQPVRRGEHQSNGNDREQYTRRTPATSNAQRGDRERF